MQSACNVMVVTYKIVAVIVHVWFGRESQNRGLEFGQELQDKDRGRCKFLLWAKCAVIVVRAAK